MNRLTMALNKMLGESKRNKALKAEVAEWKDLVKKMPPTNLPTNLPTDAYKSSFDKEAKVLSSAIKRLLKLTPYTKVKVATLNKKQQDHPTFIRLTGESLESWRLDIEEILDSLREELSSQKTKHAESQDAQLKAVEAFKKDLIAKYDAKLATSRTRVEDLEDSLNKEIKLRQEAYSWFLALLDKKQPRFLRKWRAKRKYNKMMDAREKFRESIYAPIANSKPSWENLPLEKLVELEIPLSRLYEIEDKVNQLKIDGLKLRQSSLDSQKEDLSEDLRKIKEARKLATRLANTLDLSLEAMNHFETLEEKEQAILKLSNIS